MISRARLHDRISSANDAVISLDTLVDGVKLCGWRYDSVPWLSRGRLSLSGGTRSVRTATIIVAVRCRSSIAVRLLDGQSDLVQILIAILIGGHSRERLITTAASQFVECRRPGFTFGSAAARQTRKLLNFLTQLDVHALPRVNFHGARTLPRQTLFDRGKDGAHQPNKFSVPIHLFLVVVVICVHRALSILD